MAGRLGGRRLAAPAGRRTRPTSDRVREALFSTLESLTNLSGVRFADLYAGSGAVGLEACSRGAGQVLLVESDPVAARAARANIAALAVDPQVRLVTAPVQRVLAAGPGSAGPGSGGPGSGGPGPGGADAAGTDAAGTDATTASLAEADAAETERAGADAAETCLGKADSGGTHVGGPYDVVFADPPYGLPDDALAALQRALVDKGWLAPGAIVVIERSRRPPPVSWVPPLMEVRVREYGETVLWYGRRS